MDTGLLGEMRLSGVVLLNDNRSLSFRIGRPLVVHYRTFSFFVTSSSLVEVNENGKEEEIYIYVYIYKEGIGKQKREKKK